MPTPAVESRTHTPSRAAPVAASSLGVTVTCINFPSRSMVRGRSCPPAWATSRENCALEVSSTSLTRRMRSPGRMPLTRAGLGPSAPRSLVPTTSTPEVCSATPMAMPPGISRFSGLTSTSTFFRGSSPIRDNSSSEVPAVSLLRDTAPWARRVSSSLADTAAVPAWVVRVSMDPSSRVCSCPAVRCRVSGKFLSACWLGEK